MFQHRHKQVSKDEFQRLSKQGCRSLRRFHPEQKPCDSWLRDGTHLHSLVVKLCKIQGRQEPSFKNIFETLSFFDEIEGYVPNIKNLNIRLVVDKKMKQRTKKAGESRTKKHRVFRHTFRYEVKEGKKNPSEQWRKSNINIQSPFRSSKNFRILCEVYGIMKGRLDTCRTQSVVSHCAVFRRMGLLNHYLNEREVNQCDHKTMMYIDYIRNLRSTPQIKCYPDEYAQELLKDLKKSKTTDWFLVFQNYCSTEIMRKIPFGSLYEMDSRICYYLKYIIQCLDIQWNKGVMIQANRNYSFTKRQVHYDTSSYPPRKTFKRIRNPNVPKDKEKGINYWAYNHLSGAYNYLMEYLVAIRTVTSENSLLGLARKNQMDSYVYLPQFKKKKHSQFQNRQYFEQLRKFHKYFARRNYICRRGPWVSSTLKNNDKLENMINKFITKCRQENPLFDEDLFRQRLMMD